MLTGTRQGEKYQGCELCLPAVPVAGAEPPELVALLDPAPLDAEAARINAKRSSITGEIELTSSAMLGRDAAAGLGQPVRGCTMRAGVAGHRMTVAIARVTWVFRPPSPTGGYGGGRSRGEAGTAASLWRGA